MVLFFHCRFSMESNAFARNRVKVQRWQRFAWAPPPTTNRWQPSLDKFSCFTTIIIQVISCSLWLCITTLRRTVSATIASAVHRLQAWCKSHDHPSIAQQRSETSWWPLLFGNKRHNSNSNDIQLRFQVKSIFLRFARLSTWNVDCRGWTYNV